MNYAEMLLRFLAGGTVVVVVTLLAKTRYPMLAGIMMLFPAVTLVGYYFVGPTVDATQLQAITKFSMYALSTTFVFLVAFYYAQRVLDIPTSLILSVVAWVVSAGVLVGVTYGVRT
ncbi:MAG: hypothetical protein DRI69_09775 [Bacteroidetes bacterium]|nr:MAG: hypothetical protein DRI69_09775 [Bacteroidota bacterium]